MFSFDDFEEQRFRESWESVNIVRPVDYSLFTFGESVLPYYLVCGDSVPGTPVTITSGEVRIRRPMIIGPHNAGPEFRNFFESDEEQDVARYLLARSARFSDWKFENEKGHKRIVSDSMEEMIDKLNGQLDAEEEDRVAILSAPPNLGGIAILRYAAERVWSSGPDNIQELRERGFLP